MLERLRRAHRRGATVVGLCLGALPLAQAGVLDGKTATSHWQCAALLAEPQFIERAVPVSGSDGRLSQVLEWVAGRLEQPHSIEALAQRLLESSDASVELVAQRAGFGTALSLLQHFRAVLGTAPSAYRRQFRSGGATAG